MGQAGVEAGPLDVRGVARYGKMVTDDQLSQLWAFVRGETAPKTFEQWIFDQADLEDPLGALHWELLSADYSDRDAVWHLRQALGSALDRYRLCGCPRVRDLSALDMGTDPFVQTVVATLDEVVGSQPETWWRYISRCRCCGTNWLVAQEERIYDAFFMLRVSDDVVDRAQAGEWPERFSTFEDVLSLGRQVSRPCRFLNAFDSGLIWTAEDLLLQRPAIQAAEIAHLLGLTEPHATALMRKAKRGI